MENNLSNGIDWNIHENLKAFKEGKQNIHKTSLNIKKLFGEILLSQKERRELELIANQERNRL